MAKATPGMTRPILAPDVILTWESCKRPSHVSIADGEANQDKRERKEGEHSVGWKRWHNPITRLEYVEALRFNLPL